MSTLDKEIPEHRPDIGGRAAVFVPSKSANATVMQTVKTGSGIVGFVNQDGMLTIYFENNRFNDSALFLWEHKVAKAYDRMVKQMPTVNRMSSGKDNFELVGYLQHSEIDIINMDALTRWLERTDALETRPGSSQVMLKS